jgi:eukaryotic-like serine/threonine-protein kinase
MTDLNGHMLGRYRIQRLIGAGGMAAVYEAFDTILERQVAIKLIRIDAFPPSQLASILKRFEHEAKFMARLSHASIVKVYDYGEYQGAPYLVMEYHAGGTLINHLGSPIPYRKAVRMLLPIARALEYAHKHNMLHRDVKPANILMSSEGEPVLSDFGIAKLLEVDSGFTLTGTGVGIGTPEYMAPEQGMARQIDGRADIYAVGVILFELVTGSRPFTADTPMAVIFKHAHDPLPDPRRSAPDIPEELVVVLNKAMAKLPDDRYPDMEALIAALNNLLEILPVQAGAAAPSAEPPTMIEPMMSVQTAPEPKTQIESPAAIFNYIKLFPTRTFSRSRKVLIPGSVVVLALVLIIGFALSQPYRQGSGMGAKPSVTVPISTTLPEVPLTGGNVGETEISIPHISVEPSETVTVTASVTVTITSSATATETVTPTLTPTPAKPAAVLPSATLTQEPVESKPIQPTAAPTKKPEDPTKTLTKEPIQRPTSTPTQKLIIKVSPTPTQKLSIKASPTPTQKLIIKVSPTPTKEPLIRPSSTPTPLKK